ncbi:MAG: DUF4123 domain-containing protein [Pseudomonadota bacterium]
MSFERIADFAPLDADAPRGQVPDALAPCFATAAATGLDLFAVAEAARFPNLPERLAAEGLRHRCLFTGHWAAEFGHVAPWLVQLDPADAVFAALLTRSDQPWHHFDDQSALLLWSDRSLTELHRHLRRLPRLYRDDGTVLLFRYWERDIVPIALRTEAEMMAPFVFGSVVQMVLAFGPDGPVVCRPGPEAAGMRGKLILTPRLHDAFADFAQRTYWDKLAGQLRAAGLTPADIQAFRDATVLAGFSDRDGVRKLAHLRLVVGPNLLTQDWAVHDLAETAGLPEDIRVDCLANAARDRGLIDVDAVI